MFVFGNKNITTAMIVVGGAFQAQVFIVTSLILRLVY